MEPKRELSSIDLSVITRELASIQDAHIEKIYLYGDDKLRVRLRDYEEGRIELFIETGDYKRVHRVDPLRVPDAPERPPEFAKKLRSRIAGGTLVSIEQYEFDRIVQFECERDGERTTIIAELFGDGNIVVVDSTRQVLQCLDTIRVTSRTVAPGSTYEFPSSRINPLTLSREEFEHRFLESDADVVRTLASQLNLGGLYAEEICARASVEKTRSIEESSDSERTAIYESLQLLASDIESGSTDPRIYYEDEEPFDVAPFLLEKYRETESEVFESFNAALDTYFEEVAAVREKSSEPDVVEEIKRQERIIAQQEAAIDEFEEQAAAKRAAGEALYANYDVVNELLQTVSEALDSDHSWEDIEDRLAAGASKGIPAAAIVDSVDAAEGRLEISLDGHQVQVDPEVGVEKNADAVYTEAKRIDEKREGAIEALEDTRETLESIKQRETEDSQPSEEERGPGDKPEWLSMESVPVRKPDQWFDRFRWFRTSTGYLVLGGRNADQNEELVKKYLDPGDLFFHTEAPGGPVTILKATAPNEPTQDVDFSEQTREEVAQFAVTFSSVWKEGRLSGDVYSVAHDQVSKTPESGEYIEKGSFVIRGSRTYYYDTPVGCAVGIRCQPDTRVIGGPPSVIADESVTSVVVEPGEFAQADVAKRVYRVFRERFRDTSFVRKIASPDEIGKFLPPGTSQISDANQSGMD